jgi:hypothetical protein
MKLCESVFTGINVGPNALADTVVLMPIPGMTMDKIHTAIRNTTKIQDLSSLLAAKNCTSELTHIFLWRVQKASWRL